MRDNDEDDNAISQATSSIKIIRITATVITCSSV